MSLLSSILRRALVSGSAAGGAAALAAAACAPRDGSSAYAPINAVTHCLWPRRAFAETGPSMRFTLTGLAIHQAAAIFWALFYETLLMRASRAVVADRVHGSADRVQTGRRAGATAAITAAGATTALAYAVDYHVVPKRLTPGFDAHLSDRSMFYVYAALATGFAVAALCRKD
jgi:hypothetical protein